MKMTLSVKNQSVETSGLPKDYREALCEYIWNGYEANATEVSLSFNLNATGEGIDSISITDNGEGIKYTSLSETFGSFLVSQKNTLSLKAKTKANKGKGRFSFGIFSSLAVWKTCYVEDEKYKSYSITLLDSKKEDIDYDDQVQETLHGNTGTTVTFYNIHNLSPEQLSYEELEESLLSEFSWFLYLNKNQNFRLIINGKEIRYDKHINEHLSSETQVIIQEQKFSINLIVWNNKIKEKFCCYFLTEKGVLCNVDTTTFNRNTVDFNHSVFITSAFFDQYSNISLNDSAQMELGKPEIYYVTIKELRAAVQELITKQMSIYMAEKADKEITKMMNERKTFPSFPDDDYGQLRKRDLFRVTKEIYCTEPKIFYKLSDLQEKSLLAFLNLLLSSEERENVLSIIEQIVELSTEQRARFANLLQKTKLEYIIDAIALVENRYQVIEILKALIYDLSKFTNERDHIQKIIEQHFWLFGEEYHLASADVPMRKALVKYQNILYGATEPNGVLTPDEEENRRMDIFLCSARKVEDSHSNFFEENIVVELKAPKVPLSIKVQRQIEDYMRYVRRQPQFSSIHRRWKFIAVCKEVDDEIKARYKAYEHLGKRGLIYSEDAFEIYALSWDDIFKSFDIRHSFLLDKLKFDRDSLVKTVFQEDMNRQVADSLTKTAVAL